MHEIIFALLLFYIRWISRDGILSSELTCIVKRRRDFKLRTNMYSKTDHVLPILEIAMSIIIFHNWFLTIVWNSFSSMNFIFWRVGLLGMILQKGKESDDNGCTRVSIMLKNLNNKCDFFKIIFFYGNKMQFYGW